MNNVSISDSGIYDIYIPSLDRVYPFREINTAQQKRLVKSIISGDEIYCTEFLYTLINIVKENSVENLSVDDLLITDLLLISIAMRSNSIGYKLKISVTCNSCKAKHNTIIDLDKIYNSLIDKLTKINDKVNVSGGIICKIPSLSKEKDFLYSVKSVITTNKNLLQSFLVLNTDRYVNTNVNTLKDKVNYYTELPGDVVNDLLININNFNKLFSDIELFNFPCVKNCDKHHRKVLSIDVEFFYEFLKLLFFDDLLSLYKDIYYLQKIGIQPEYSETLTANERQVLWNYFLADEKEKNKKSDMLIKP